MTTTAKQDTGTRRAILDRIKREGPQEAKALGEHLALSTMAIRLHLSALRDEGLIEGQRVPRKRGRPATAWALTPASDALFPDTHDALAVDLLTAMRETFGPEGMKALLAVRAKKQIADYRASMTHAHTLQARAEALAQRRTSEGYMAVVEPDPDNPDAVLLIERHCPICDAARACQGLCANELEVFQAAMGDDAQVVRTEHLLSGERRCVYRITAA